MANFLKKNHQTGGQPFSHTSPNKVSEYSLTNLVIVIIGDWNILFESKKLFDNVFLYSDSCPAAVLTLAGNSVGIVSNSQLSLQYQLQLK